MREILFRGKQNGGEWVEGCLLFDEDGFDIGALYWDETFSQWIGNIHDNPELLKGGVRE